MVRENKNANERKKDILDSAENLFREKGYEGTIVSDIVKNAGIAQGTFYIYYKSKDDIFVAVLERIKKQMHDNLIDIVNRNNINAVEKLNLVVKTEFELNRKEDVLFSQLHLDKNEGIHQKYIISTINSLLPIYTSIIEQGINEGRFNTKYPKEVAEYMLVATKFLFDPGNFPVSEKGLDIKIKAAQEISERILGAKENSLLPPDVDNIIGG